MSPSSNLHPDAGAAAGSVAGQLSHLFDQAPALIAFLSGSEHVFDYANAAYRRLVGDRELLGRTVAEALPELAAQGFVELLDRCYRSGEPFTGEGLPTEIVGADGSAWIGYFDFIYQPVRGASGLVEGIFCQGSDVSDRVAAEQALRASEARFADIFGQVSVGIAQVDLTGRFQLVNERQRQILGRESDEIYSLTMQQVTHPDDLPENMRLFGRLLETGQSFQIEKRYLRPDGSSVWVQNHVSLVRDHNGAPQYVTAVVVDISGQRQAEVALRRSEAASRAMLHSALDSIVTIAADSRIVEWNPAAERTFGYTREEALGQDMATLIIPPELREPHRKGMERFVRMGRGPMVGRRVEVDAVRRSGDRLPIELAISPIEIDGEIHFTAYLRDISGRIATEAALRESEERLLATYEHAFVGIAEVDEYGRFLRTNEQFSAITGYDRDELSNMTIWDVTHPEDTMDERGVFARQMAGEIPVYSREKRYVQKSGAIVWVELSASVVRNAEGAPLYGVRVVRDITERRRWQDRQQLLMNELNHRVKNTLATVQSIAAQTQRSAADPRAAHGAFVDRLLALSSAHDVLTRQQWRGADLREIVDAAIRPFSGDNEERFQICGPAIWLAPQAAVALALALHELATNAVKYGALSAPAGSVSVTWLATPAAADERLHLEWREENGPAVTPPTRTGFGSRLLEQGLAGELGGEVGLDYRPKGLVCTVRAPLHGASALAPAD
ncbi:PAS domain S-box protein [Phenylobacterium sp.]|jgi:PAS domain S-box-containing protein|uniref:PAS domain S-box protein n=1 Tax=Phenylobacterium sp. TaxID=1871053 RepID=UPI002E36D59E|nr:PAS domain S-box protein [Phenylobacterium sp.]HEX2560931.1 PAS domain S-box protein [Phenylobacterium sp.]